MRTDNASGLTGQGRMRMGVVLAGFCAFLQLYSTQSLLPYLRQVFAASELQVSQTISAATIAVAIASPIIGILADSIGRKRVVVAALLALAVPTLLAATATGLHQLIFWRFVQGLFIPGVLAVTMAYVSEEAKAGSAGSLMSAYVTGTVIGGFSGRFLAALAAAYGGWRFAFVLLGLLTLLGGVATWWCLPRSRNFQRHTDLRSPLHAMLRHLRNPRLLATYAVGFSVLFTHVGTFTYVSFYLAGEPFRLGTVQLGLIFLVYLLGVVVTPLAGRWIDRAGHRTALVTAMLVAGGGALLTLLPVLWGVIAGLAVLSTGVFMAQSAASSYVGVAAKEARSAAAGAYVSLYYLGGSVGTLVLGLLWGVGRWPACVAMVLGVQLLTAIVATVFWQERGPAHVTEETPPPTE